jgi:hypothetical protein
MQIVLPSRINALHLVTATALVMMCILALGSFLRLFASPALTSIQDLVNPLLGFAVLVLDAASIVLVFLALSWASTRGESHANSVFGRNQLLFSLGRVPAVVVFTGTI